MIARSSVRTASFPRIMFNRTVPPAAPLPERAAPAPTATISRALEIENSAISRVEMRVFSNDMFAVASITLDAAPMPTAVLSPVVSAPATAPEWIVDSAVTLPFTPEDPPAETLSRLRLVAVALVRLLMVLTAMAPPIALLALAPVERATAPLRAVIVLLSVAEIARPSA